MTSDKKEKNSYNPVAILQVAIEELDVFTHPEATLIELGEDGRIKASQETSLEKMIGLARRYVAPLFSQKARQRQKEKIEQLKWAVLRVLDIIESHSPLFEKLKQGGSESEKELVRTGLEVIKRYNSLLLKDEVETSLKKRQFASYERAVLLADKEIKGRKIELPYQASILYESDPEKQLSTKLRNVLSQTQRVGSIKIVAPTQKATHQFMVDTFRLKGRRLAEAHLSHLSFLEEIFELIRSTPVQILEDIQSQLIQMEQLLEIGPGSWILLTGCFKKNQNIDQKFMAMPVLDSFGLSSQLTHSGFPYPSQHLGWSLGEDWIVANPLRSEQTPLFSRIDRQKKELGQQLLNDPMFSRNASLLARKKGQVFNQHRSIFIPLHRQLQECLRDGFGLEPSESDQIVLDAFYEVVNLSISPFDFLVSTQEKIIDVFIKKPLQSLQEEWLSPKKTLLRTGTPQERLKVVSDKLDHHLQMACEQFNSSDPQEAFILLQGTLLGSAFQGIVLQHLSEKIKFPPRMLGDFERRLQICAFEELLLFIEESKIDIDTLHEDDLKKRLEEEWLKKIQFLVGVENDEDSFSCRLANELECYFNSRFFSQKHH